MASHLPVYMFWVRMCQVASITVVLGTNGFLIHHISTRKLGLTPRMIAIQNMAGFVLLYTLISILVLHICRKSARTGYVIISILGDMLFTGVCIGILSIYSIAGVPADCGGLTRENWGPGDAPNNPHKGFDTIRFGHGLYGSYGELDIYCELPITDFAMTVILIFTYTLNIVLSVLRVLSVNYTHKSEVHRLLVEAEMKGKASYSDLATLITSVAASHSFQPPSPIREPSEPAPSFHSSPLSSASTNTNSNSNSYIPPRPRSDSPAPSFHSSPVTHYSSPITILSSRASTSTSTSTSPSISTSPSTSPTTDTTTTYTLTFPTSPSPLTSGNHPLASPSSLLYLPDAEEIDMADGLISDGRRPSQYQHHSPYHAQNQTQNPNQNLVVDGNEDIDGALPPYMPNSNPAAESGRAEELRRWGKDGEFPGL